MEKVNLQSCFEASLLAKLLLIQLKYLTLKDELLSDRKAFNSFVEDQILKSFIYTEIEYPQITAHLSLFLLNNPDNSFSKLFNQKTT